MRVCSRGTGRASPHSRTGRPLRAMLRPDYCQTLAGGREGKSLPSWGLWSPGWRVRSVTSPQVAPRDPQNYSRSSCLCPLPLGSVCELGSPPPGVPGPHPSQPLAGRPARGPGPRGRWGWVDCTLWDLFLLGWSVVLVPPGGSEMLAQQVRGFQGSLGSSRP